MAKNKQQNTPKPRQQPQPQAVSKTTPAPRQAAAITTSKMPTEKWLMVALAVLVLAVNIRTLGYDYTLDDPFFTKENPNVSKGVSNIKEFFTHAAYYGVFKNHDASYRPLMLTSFALEKDLFDFNPQRSHLINLLLFALEVVVLYRLMRQLFKEMSPYIPFFIALLFAVHPIHTEVVASVKSRDEILGLLFGALALLQSLKFIDTSNNKHLVFSALWFFCALMSKETPITLVVLVPMTIYFFRSESMSRIIRATAPYIIVAVIYMGMRAAFIESDGEKVRILVNNNALMAATTYSDKLATILWIQLKYIILLFVPHPLSWDYSYSQIPIISMTDPKALASVAVIVGLAVYAIRGIKKKDVYAYCILFYGISAALTSNLLVDIGATMAERFIFSGSLGFCIAVVFLLTKLMKTDMVHADFNTARPLFITVIIIGVLYSGKTMARNQVWENNTTLYESGMETAPNSWRAQYLLAVEYTKTLRKETNPAVKKELFTKSIEHFNKSLAILPNNVDVYILMGYAYDFMPGYEDSAIAAYRKTVELSPARNDARSNLGAMYLRKGLLDSAIKTLTVAVANDSLNTGAITNLGAAYGNKGMFKEAEGYYLHAVRINPVQPPNVYQSMTNIYKFMGDSVKSRYYAQELAKALQREKQAAQQ